MKKRSVSSAGRDFIPISEERLDRLVLPSTQEYRNQFENYVAKKNSLDKQVYLKLLKSLEEELLMNISKLQNNTESSDTDFLIVKKLSNSNPVEQAKLLYWKKLYSVNYLLNKQVYEIDYGQYEEVQSLLESKQELLREMKDIFKNAVKYCVHLKEKNKLMMTFYNK